MSCARMIAWSLTIPSFLKSMSGAILANFAFNVAFMCSLLARYFSSFLSDFEVGKILSGSGLRYSLLISSGVDANIW